MCIIKKHSSPRLLLIGFGLMEGDFTEEEKVLKEKVANIEPLVEAQLQIIIQSVIIYTITFENQIDLSSLLYSDTTSKITYFLMLLSSLVSICISFTKMLHMGHEPAITSVFTVRAAIIFLFLVTKFLLLAYIHSLAITSMMLGTVGSTLADNNAAHKELFDIFYRGLCPPSKDPSAFCGENPPFTFYSATRTLPIIVIFQLYFLPTLYLITLNIKRARTLSYETIMHLLFPLVTNLFFYGPVPLDPFERSMKKAKWKRVNSMPCLHGTDKKKNRTRVGTEKALFRQKTVPNSSSGARHGDEVFVIRMSSLDIDIERLAFQRENQESPLQRTHTNNKTWSKRFSLPTNMEPCLTRGGSEKEKDKFQFSLWQSTVLYSMFLYSAIVIGLVDLGIQIVNMGHNQCKRKGIECNVDGGEQMTVLDILMKLDPINQAYLVILITNIIAFVSFAISLKNEKGRVSCLSSTTCNFVQETINDQ